MPTIGLSMIVKNEAAVIRRCLESVLPLVDFLAIADTGSTDDTKKILGEILYGCGKLHVFKDYKWKDFATNRNEALSLLSANTTRNIDYAFVIDADDILEMADDFDPIEFKRNMDKDVYVVRVRHGSIVHWRPQIFRLDPKKFYWKGVVHEFVVTPDGRTSENVPGLTIKASNEGSRNKDPQKFQRDAEMIQAALSTETDPFMRSRYTFYLAQSHRDSQNDDKALKFYLQRAQMGMWPEEVYVALLEAMRCYARMGAPNEKILACLEMAQKINPARVEALHSAAFTLRNRKDFKRAAEIAKRGIMLGEPAGLFIESWIYKYGIADEYAVAAFHAGDPRTCLEMCLKLMASQAAPPDLYKRLADNALVSWNAIAPPLAAEPADDDGSFFGH